VTAVLYAATAIVLLWLADRYVLPISRGAAITLLLLPLVFTGRAVLTGRAYAPVEMPYMTRPLYDYRVALHVPPTHNPTLADIAFQMIPWREAVRRSFAEGEWPLWNRFMSCGDILAAGMQPAVYSPFTWIACLLPAAVSFSYTGSIAFFLAGLGAFLFARELGAAVEAAIIAAIGCFSVIRSALRRCSSGIGGIAAFYNVPMQRIAMALLMVALPAFAQSDDIAAARSTLFLTRR